MIRNRLSELLSERNLKITQVAKDTGISRNTITSTSQNDSKMIQLETLNTLCKYLGITPCDFFVFTPVDFIISPVTDKLDIEYYIGKLSSAIVSITHYFDVFVDIEHKTKVETFSMTGSINYRNSEFQMNIVVNFENNDSMLTFENVRNSLPTGLVIQMVNQFKGAIGEFVNTSLEEYFEQEVEKDFLSKYDLKTMKDMIDGIDKTFTSDSTFFVPF